MTFKPFRWALSALLAAGIGASASAQQFRCLDENGRNASRIVGGVEASLDEAPYQVALRIRTRRGVALCGGSLLSRGVVVTAAHCLAGAKVNDIQVGVGSERLRSMRWLQVRRAHVHPRYDRRTFRNDIAVLILNTPAPQRRHQRVRVATEKLDQLFGRRGSCSRISGWGAISEKGPTSEQLRVADVRILPNAGCPTLTDPSTQICAGYGRGRIDSCQGDSGGPLVVGDGPTALLLGVVSHGQGCARAGKAGVYTRVAAFVPWIRQVVSR